MIPKEFNYFEIYLTFCCPLSCPYCINKYSYLDNTRKEVSANEWIKFLNCLELGDLPITIGGGEPTQYQEFYKIMDEIKRDIKIDLLTNLQFDVHKFAELIPHERFNFTPNPAYKSIRVSYHPKQMNPVTLVKKVKFLQEEGYSIGIFGLNCPDNIDYNIMMSELARENRVYFFIKEFIGYYKGGLFGNFAYPEGLSKKEKKVECRTTEILIAPDGGIFKCHYDLYSNKHPLGYIIDNPKFEYKFRLCESFGLCNPCDIKRKANRFLQAGHCSVEINEVL